jgi:hypothetical protein
MVLMIRLGRMGPSAVDLIRFLEGCRSSGVGSQVDQQRSRRLRATSWQHDTESFPAKLIPVLDGTSYLRRACGQSYLRLLRHWQPQCEISLVLESEQELHRSPISCICHTGEAAIATGSVGSIKWTIVPNGGRRERQGDASQVHVRSASLVPKWVVRDTSSRDQYGSA